MLPIGNYLARKLGYAGGREVFAADCCSLTGSASQTADTTLPAKRLLARRLGFANGRELYGSWCCLPADSVFNARMLGRKLGFANGRELYVFSEPCCTESFSSSASSGSVAPVGTPSCDFACLDLAITQLDMTVGMGDDTTVWTTLTVTSSAGFPATPFFAQVDTGEIMVVTNVAGVTWTVQRGCDQRGVCSGIGQALSGSNFITWVQDPPDTLFASVDWIRSSGSPTSGTESVTLTRYPTASSMGETSPDPLNPDALLCGWGGTFVLGSCTWTLYLQLTGVVLSGWAIHLKYNGTSWRDNSGSFSPDIQMTENSCIPLDLSTVDFENFGAGLEPCGPDGYNIAAVDIVE